MRKPRKSKPSSICTTLVLSAARRSPTPARTVATSSHRRSACSRLPLTMTTKSSQYRTRRYVAPPRRRWSLRAVGLRWRCQTSAKCSSRTDRARLASSGEITPPTQWITRRMVTLRIVGVGLVGSAVDDWDAVADGDVLGADEDVFDDQAQH